MNRNQRIYLRSAARAATTATSGVLMGQGGNLLPVGPHLEYDQSCCRFYLNVSAASGTGGLTFQLRGYDKASGNAAIIAADSTPILTTGLYLFEFGINTPGPASSAKRITASEFLPVQWDVQIVHGDGSSYTYSLSMETTA